VRLSAETLDALPPDVARPGYDRAAQRTGIVHFGLGAFARAHLAAHTDAAMGAGARDWMIAGVSLRSDSVARQLDPQDELYTLTERHEAEQDVRLVGALHEVLVAGPDDDAIVERIASPDCRIVSFTVTEKGYCRGAGGGLDFRLAGDGFYPLLAAGLTHRMQQGLQGLTLLSCDNLSANGDALGKLVMLWLERESPDASDWFAAHCTTPNTMVDRIVPAASADDLDELERRIGMRDDGAVLTERFSQWVIEDDFAGPRPRWEEHGAQIVDDVAPYETAKLRMLNGAHSLLAYEGLRRGYACVHEAMADPALRALVRRLMRKEAAPTIAAASGQDLAAYADALEARFEDPALKHRLAQIAMDGSQKIPQRWLETLAESGARCGAILTGIAAWIAHIADGCDLDDPRGSELQAVVREAGRAGAARAVFGAGGSLASAWQPSEAELAFIMQATGENER